MELGPFEKITFFPPDPLPQSQKRCGSCKRWKGGKRSLSNKIDNQEQTVSKDKEKKRGRISKTLPTIPTQEVNIPLVVECASCSPLTGGINANDSSIGPSIGMSSYDDATIGDNTVSRDTNDELIRILDDNDANEIGDGGTSDAEGEGYECVISFNSLSAKSVLAGEKLVATYSISMWE